MTPTQKRLAIDVGRIADSLDSIGYRLEKIATALDSFLTVPGNSFGRAIDDVCASINDVGAAIVESAQESGDG